MFLMQESGLSDVIGEALTVFDVLPDWFMVTVIAFITALLTEVTSNTATCTLLMPIVSNMVNRSLHIYVDIYH